MLLKKPLYIAWASFRNATSKSYSMYIGAVQFSWNMDSYLEELEVMDNQLNNYIVHCVLSNAKSTKNLKDLVTLVPNGEEGCTVYASLFIPYLNVFSHHYSGDFLKVNHFRRCLALYVRDPRVENYRVSTCVASRVSRRYHYKPIKSRYQHAYDHTVIVVLAMSAQIVIHQSYYPRSQRRPTQVHAGML